MLLSAGCERGGAKRMKRVVIVVGTRPEAIKMAPVILSFQSLLQTRPELGLAASVCVTGQHREMLDQVLEFFGIAAAYDLDVMRARQDLTDLTVRVLAGMRDALRHSNAGLLLVHGDTTTTLAAALAAYYERITVAHVEAGLRTGDIYSPWPEEINRKLTAGIAALHFAPTEGAAGNLRAEGVSQAKIQVTGNTVIDALLQTSARIAASAELRRSLESRFSFLIGRGKLILVTGHRRENLGSGFEGICRALQKLAQRQDVVIAYPVHPNPSVREPVQRMLGNCARVCLIEPLDYLSFVYLMGKSYFVLTDSGGIQEEAPSLGKPVLVMRSTTERPESIAAGTARLVGVDAERIVEAAVALLDCPEVYRQMTRAKNPYGDGRAAGRIVEGCLKLLGLAVDRNPDVVDSLAP